MIDRIQALETDLTNRVYELDLLKELGTAVVSELNLEKLFKLVTERARGIIQAETLLLVLLDDDCTHYTYRAGSGLNAAEIVGETLPLEMGVCGWVWRNKRPWWRGMLHELSEIERNQWENEAGHLILVPLTGRSHFLGGLAGINKIGGGDFTQRDIDLLLLLSNQVAIAIDNATLFEEIQKAKHQSDLYLEQLEGLNVTLEQRVTDRTEQLAKANINLQQTAIELEREKDEQKALVRRLQESQNQLLQSEKMASIGQLAAGVAHEINNPIGYVHSNLSNLGNSTTDLLRLISSYEALEPQLLHAPESLQRLYLLKREIDLNYIREDLPNLIRETRDGVTRVKQIVQDLKDFSHVDDAEWQFVDIQKGLQSTLNIVSNEIKYKAEVVCELVDLPEIECLPSQINQVFMNLLVNAAQSITTRGTITIRAGHDEAQVWVSISDTGTGIDPKNITKIFDPFFTTKPVGKGTGLGLSLSYGIVKKHGGELTVDSEIGKGTTFTLCLPRQQMPEQPCP